MDQVLSLLLEKPFIWSRERLRAWEHFPVVECWKVLKIVCKSERDSEKHRLDGRLLERVRALEKIQALIENAPKAMETSTISTWSKAKTTTFCGHPQCGEEVGNVQGVGDKTCVSHREAKTARREQQAKVVAMPNRKFDRPKTTGVVHSGSERRERLPSDMKAGIKRTGENAIPNSQSAW